MWVATLLLAWGLSPVTASPSPLEAIEALPPLLGEASSDLIVPGDTMLDVAYRNRVGFELLSNLNREVDTWIPDPGTVVRLPSDTVVPKVERTGLVLNIPEMRLYDFTVDGPPIVLAVAVGDADDPTPIGDFEIRDKRIDPVWTVPRSILEKKPQLPERVPPGESNPLGSRWLRIGDTSYGLHGTNIRWSIGRESTHGCVRLYEADVEQLYERVPEGTRIQILYQPFKWGRRGGEIFFEAHPDRYGRVRERLAEALAPLRALGLLDRVELEKVWQTLEESRGVPVSVGMLPEIEETPPGDD